MAYATLCGLANNLLNQCLSKSNMHGLLIGTFYMVEPMKDIIQLISHLDKYTIHIYL